MARMSSCHMCCLFTVLLFILVSLGLIVTSIVTDFWYSADGNDSPNATVRRDFTYHFGMWRKCYENGIPTCKYLFPQKATKPAFNIRPSSARQRNAI